MDEPAPSGPPRLAQYRQAPAAYALGRALALRKPLRDSPGDRGLAESLARYHFSILQRKVLTPNDYDDLAVLARALNEFERRWNEVAEPFEWNFTGDDLAKLMDRLAAHEPQLRLAA